MTAPAPSGGPSPLRVGGIALLVVGAVAAVIGVGTLVGGGGDGSSTATAPTTTALAPAPAPTSDPVAVPSFTGTPTTAPAPGGTGTDGSGGAGGSGTGGAAGAGGAGGTGSGSGGTGSGGTGSGGSGTAAGGTGAAGSGGGQGVVRSPVRVYNNSTITGLAARAAQDFRNAGWEVSSVANYSQGTIPASTVYYRPGTNEQAAAEAMAAQFGIRSEPRFTGLDEASSGLIVIVTNNYRSRA